MGGSDSVSTACSFCLYAIATHPHVQEKLQQEIDAVLEKHDGIWSYDTIKDMKYLDQVFNGMFTYFTGFICEITATQMWICTFCLSH